MNQATKAFYLSAILFATGTSVIGYSLAQEYTSSGAVTAAALPGEKITWYCVPDQTNTKPANNAGYYSPGYVNPGYTIPGYTVPGYLAPGYITPGYAIPGYITPGYGAPGYITPGYQANGSQFSANIFNQNWEKTLKCSKGYTPHIQYVGQKCGIVLQKKLNGSKLPADSAEQYRTCQSIIKKNVWDAKISESICKAYSIYEKDCAVAQKRRQKCAPLTTYLIKSGVGRKDLPKVQADAVYACKNVFPM